MDTITIDTPLRGLQSRGLIPATARGKLEAAGCATARDILLLLPRDYSDRTVTVPLSKYRDGEVNTVVTVCSHNKPRHSRAPLTITIKDESTEAELVCFGRSNLRYVLPVDGTFYLSGSFTFRYQKLQTSQFEFEPVTEKRPLYSRFNRVLPLYTQIGGISQKRLDSIIQSLLDACDLSAFNSVTFDAAGYALKPLGAALRGIHRPKTLPGAYAARATLVRYELLALQYRLQGGGAAPRHRRPAPTSAPPDAGADRQTPYTFDERLQKTIDALPFPMTADQLTVLQQICREIAPPATTPPDSAGAGAHVMRKLLQGDVGVGKTLAALLATVPIIAAGGQCAFMVPTELLSHQQYASAQKILAPALAAPTQGQRGMALLTGSTPRGERERILGGLADGTVGLIIGTHALFSKQVVYKNLRLIIIDEQQRFGVQQRVALKEKGERVHQLYMTATPIPRSLTLGMYGNYDIAAIKTYPKGRRTVRTHLVKQSNETRAYAAVKAELDKGRQAYFVYPQIGLDGTAPDDPYGESLFDQPSSAESPSAERAQPPAPQPEDTAPAAPAAPAPPAIRGAAAMYEELQSGHFRDYQLACIHSKLDDQQKIAIMDAFVSGKTQVLIATSVIEVGVDVPNATCMLVDHAERFGLSTLHQLRGRVGRGSEQSYAFLMYDDTNGLTDTTKSRLKVLYEESDGFFISEVDLCLRGPGDIVGKRQSGGSRLRVAAFPRDLGGFKAARNAISDIYTHGSDADVAAVNAKLSMLHGVFSDGGVSG